MSDLVENLYDNLDIPYTQENTFNLGVDLYVAC